MPGLGEKNIRRRVYDCLNVLLSANVISKVGKRLVLASTAIGGCDKNTIAKLKSLKTKVAQKRTRLTDMSNKYISFKGLVERNRKLHAFHDEIIELPYILLATPNEQTNSISIKLNQSSEKVFLSFTKPVEIIQDMDCIKRIKIMRKMEDLPSNAIKLIKS